MGKATRWLKGLFGIKNPNEKDQNFDKKHKKSVDSAADSNGLCYNPATIPPNLSPAEAAWLNSFYGETEKEQSKHAIAVAAATAAAADAAVAAAHAAAAVVRLTSQGRGTMFDGGCRERWAAVKIQSVFRGYLARKALRALKALVKLQANFRGYLVRKQATATLQSMQALIRAQAAVRSRRARNSTRNSNNNSNRARNSTERFDETRSEHTASIHSKRLSNLIDANLIVNSAEETPKIVEIDANFRSKSRSRRTNASVDFFSDDPLYIPSPVHSKLPTRLSLINAANFHDADWGFAGDEWRFPTAHGTPRLPNFNPPPTPARSVCADGVFRQLGGCPGYMANTMSFKAKLRSQSAPKQRPEIGSRRRVSLNELMESRNSVSGIRRSPARAPAEEPVSFKRAVLGKFDRCLATEIQRK